MNIVNEYKYNFKLNKKSLLFARIASDAINDGDYEKALLILENGIEQFDDYPTPFFLMGDLLIKMGKIVEAKIAFKKGDAILNNSSTLNYYLNINPDIKGTVDTDIDPDPSANKVDALEKLEDKLQTAKIEIKHDDYSNADDPKQRESAEEFKPLKGLVSETLASIYLNQSNYKEAKAIYETLIDIHPERELYFMSKLSEIELKITPRKKEDG